MRRVAIAIAAVLAFGATAAAAEIEVRMLNKGADGVMVFEPSLIKAAPGDTIKFVATDKGHNVESIAAMLPEGAKAFAGKTNEEVSIQVEKAGVYGFMCKPHYGMGMVGMIVVGDPINEEQAKAVTHPGRAKQKFASLFETLAAIRTAAK